MQPTFYRSPSHVIISVYANNECKYDRPSVRPFVGDVT